jgi:hypothetical protein
MFSRLVPVVPVVPSQVSKTPGHFPRTNTACKSAVKGSRRPITMRRWTAAVGRRWENSEFFKRWHDEPQAGRGPHQAV